MLRKQEIIIMDERGQDGTRMKRRLHQLLILFSGDDRFLQNELAQTEKDQQPHTLKNGHKSA